MNTRMDYLAALKSAVQSRNWVLVEMACDSLESSLSEAFESLVGTSETPTLAGEKLQDPTSAFWRDHYKDMRNEQYRNRFQSELDLLRERGAIEYLQITQDAVQAQKVLRAGLKEDIKNAQEAHYADVHVGTCKIDSTGTCTCGDVDLTTSLCNHFNDRYGWCILEKDHGPINNGGGVFYDHQYKMQDVKVDKGSSEDPDWAKSYPVDWDSYDTCHYCKVPAGARCVTGKTFGGGYLSRPHGSRKKKGITYWDSFEECMYCHDSISTPCLFHGGWPL